VTHVFRYFAPEDPREGVVMALAEADQHHAARVVRRREGAEIELIGADGRLWPARVASLGPPVEVEVTGPPRLTPAPAPVAVYQGLAEWSRLDWLVEKLTELGVAEVTIVASERARRVPSEAEWLRRRDRFRRVAESAARQAGTGAIPDLRGVVAFDAAVEEIAHREGYLLQIGSGASLQSALAARSGDDLAVLVGPEAGFSGAEVERAAVAGITLCGLGASVLRAETAALAAAVTCLSAVGRLDPPAES
jgi:16S rRNA (uracil1498-N3)-methyltransferase